VELQLENVRNTIFGKLLKAPRPASKAAASIMQGSLYHHQLGAVGRAVCFMPFSPADCVDHRFDA
jgi:hypothetical protein